MDSKSVGIIGKHNCSGSSRDLSEQYKEAENVGNVE